MLSAERKITFHLKMISSEYDEFKKISIEDYSQYGISEEDLNGRKTLGGVVVYAPREYLLDGENCRLLAGDGSYNMYELVNEEK